MTNQWPQLAPRSHTDEANHVSALWLDTHMDDFIAHAPEKPTANTSDEGSDGILSDIFGAIAGLFGGAR